MKILFIYYLIKKYFLIFKQIILKNYFKYIKQKKYSNYFFQIVINIFIIFSVKFNLNKE